MDDGYNGFKDETNSKLENIKIEKRGKPKGSPKSGGRTKGTPNKVTSRWSEVLASNDFSIAEEAIGMFRELNTPANIKFQILQFLAQYTTAAIKPKEDNDLEQQENQSITDILMVVNE